MGHLRDLPLLVILIAVAGLAMLVPAGFALATGAGGLAGTFAKSALLTLTGAAVLGAATARRPAVAPERSQLLSLIAAYAVLPPLLAFPLAEALPGFGYGRAWFEMVSSMTTTGATLLAPGTATPAPVHLWNALVGWLGGFLVLLAATALLAPLNLGGLEVGNPRPVGRPAFAASPIHDAPDPLMRLAANARLLAPIYAALTLALWIALLVAGETPFVGLAHAMGILSTSGISPLGGTEHGDAGRAGEALMLGFLVFALSRRSLPGGLPADRRRAFHREPELRLALVLVTGLALILTLRMALAAAGENPAELAAGFWGAAFTMASFLTTTGYVSADWATGLERAGLAPPALLLAGLAMVGGGVATTAGGIKLLRVFALYRHGRHEMERLLEPSLVAGGGERARHLRSDGAYLAWVAFMLFLLSLAAAVAALALAGLAFEPALVLAIAALSTTGPLAAAAGDPGLGYDALGGTQRAILAGIMVLGRLELLAIVALLVPDSWRR
jgi:trk system potassium uptake protein TrkH